jgi:hypothetical protein
LFGCAPPVFLNVAVTFGSGTGLRRARAFLFQEIEASLDFSSFGFRLMTQPESSNDFVVLLYVRLLQVLEQTSAMLDHFQQPTPRMIVLLVRLEMLGEFVNALT